MTRLTRFPIPGLLLCAAAAQAQVQTQAQTPLQPPPMQEPAQTQTATTTITQTPAPTLAPEPTPAPEQTPAQTSAQAPARGPVHPDHAPPEPGRIDWLEKTRYYTWRGTHWLASAVNGWFGDKPFDEGGKVSGYVRISPLWEQHDGLNATLRFRVRADLPNLMGGNTYAFIGQDNEREVVADTPDAFTREQLLRREERRHDQSFFAGLGRQLDDALDFRLGFRGGLSPYAQARYSKQWAFSPQDTLLFRESLFWSSSDSLGSTTLLEYEHRYAADLQLRWSTVGTITRRSHGLEWQSALGLFKQLPGLRSTSVEMLVEGETGEVDVSNYGVRTTWRQPIYRDWLFGKVTLGHFWPKEKANALRERSWAVGFSVEMHF